MGLHGWQQNRVGGSEDGGVDKLHSNLRLGETWGKAADWKNRNPSSFCLTDNGWWLANGEPVGNPHRPNALQSGFEG